MSLETVEYIQQKLLDHGFKKKALKNHLILSLGDNYFEKTKKFARYSVLLNKGKFNIAAMTASRIGKGERVSLMDWAESATVKSKDFDSAALRILNNLLAQLTH